MKTPGSDTGACKTQSASSKPPLGFGHWTVTIMGPGSEGVSHHVALQWSLLLLSCCCGCRVSSVARHKLCCVLRFIFVRMAHMLKLSSVEVSWSSVELSSVGHRIAS